MIISKWKILYKIRPVACGGCLPLQIAEGLTDSGISAITRHVIVLLGIPSEITPARQFV